MKNVKIKLFRIYLIKEVNRNNDYWKDQAFLAAIYFRNLGSKCTWSDMWNEALICFAAFLGWAQNSCNQELITQAHKNIKNAKETIQYQKQQAILKEVEKRELYYEGEWGLIFKEKVKISSKGLEYKGKCIPLSAVKKVLWGVIKNTTNGLPTGTDYLINVCSDTDGIYLSTNKTIYLELTDRLWKAVAPQIINIILKSLKCGMDAGFGMDVQDKGIHYKEHKWFSKDIDRFYTWNEIGISHGNGTLDFVNSNGDVLASYSYLDTHNVHMLEAIVNMAKNKRLARLSDLLK